MASPVEQQFFASDGPELFQDEINNIAINEQSEELETHMSFVDNNIDRANQRASQKSNLSVCLLGIPLLLGITIASFMFFANHRSHVEAGTTGNSAGGGGGVPVSSTFLLPPPPLDLASRCSPDSPLIDCEESCEVAECCDFPTNLPLSCLAGNEQTCLSYHQYCHVLTDSSTKTKVDPSNAIIPPAPANLGNLCSSDNILTIDGFQECDAECSHASCCYDKSVTTCQHENCMGYSSCLVLTATTKTHDTISKHVEKACANDNLETFQGRSSCRKSCVHALCCFQGDDNSVGASCPHTDLSFCEQYTACDSLEKNVDIRATAIEIKDACGGATPHSSLCEAECERGACCFGQDGCDTVFPDVVCSNYGPCKQLYSTRSFP